MKRKVMLLFLFITILIGSTQAQQMIVKDIKKDFGARGDGKTNDHAAFEAAAAFINARKGNCTLNIPVGTYRVGKQVTETNRIRSGRNVLTLNYCNNVVINGAPGAKLLYNDNLYYGYFDPKTKRPAKLANRKMDVTPYSADLGYCIYIRYCQNISVKGLTLDGNMYAGKMNIGGNYNYLFHGIQQTHYGIAIFHSKNVALSNVIAQRFGLDGFYILNTSPREFIAGNIAIDNCLSDYNGRQGLSIVAGDGINISNCTFSNTGKGIITETGLQLGIDLEPEAAGYKIKNVNINDCKFANNKMYAVAATSGQGTIERVVFNRCMLDGPNKINVELGKHQGIRFDNCKIKGAVRMLDTKKTVTTNDNLRLVNCTFTAK